MTNHGVFDIREFGAAGDGRTLDSPAIQAAIDACHAAGGGMAYCPPGDYLIGTIELKSHVNLHVEAGAMLRGSTDRSAYRTVSYGSPERGPAVVMRHLIVADGAENIAVTGRGTIDGQGDEFFGPVPPGQPPTRQWRTVRDWRPDRMFGIRACRRVRIEDVTIRDSAGFTVWLLGCDGVRIRGINIFNNPWGPNTDGITPDCCSDVHISDCRVDNGDDCISVKSDTYLLGRAKACENITVTNCVLSTTGCGVRIGYEGDAPIRNCVFSNLVMTRCRTGINMLVPRHLARDEAANRDFAYIQHGPTIENISFSNLVMDTRCPIYLWIGDAAAAPGAIRNIAISDCIARSQRACYIGGAKHLPIEGLRISNFRLEVRGEMDDGFAAAAPYPYDVWDYWKQQGAPHAFYCRHARGVEFHNVRVAWGQVSGPWRSALRMEQVDDVTIDGLVAGQAPGGTNAPAVHLTDVRGAFVRGCRAEPGTGAFLCADGATSRRIATANNDLAEAATPYSVGEGNPPIASVSP
ncbi:MAG: glycosyl hydrolase family 28 protein [Phycisphaerae bacterium]|nr:glycosyl hydrolase family 28 protein [Phycisphaerae bacterium]